LWLRIWTLMNTVMRHFKFHDRQRISWIEEQQFDS
jgi:hypothetical protein